MDDFKSEKHRAANGAPADASWERGTVKFYNAAKGYGFIARTNGGEDIIFGRSDLRLANITPPLADGQPVLFVVGHRPKGSFARDIKLDGEKLPIIPAAPALPRHVPPLDQIPAKQIRHNQVMQVDWFDRDRGYGFLIEIGSTPEINGVFIHGVSLQGRGPINEGDMVRVDIWEGSQKGPIVIAVKEINPQSVAPTPEGPERPAVKGNGARFSGHTAGDG